MNLPSYKINPMTDQPVPMVLRLPKRTTPYITYTLVGLTISIYILQWVFFLSTGDDIIGAIGMKWNEAIRAGQYWRLLTPMLLHSIYNPLHIAFNMYFLYRAGQEIEILLGRKRYTALYLLGALAGNVISFLFSTSYSLGASTALFAILGAQVFILWRNVKTVPQLRTMLNSALLNLAINVAYGFLNARIDNAGHLGGLLGGLLFSLLAGPIYAGEFRTSSQGQEYFEISEARTMLPVNIAILISLIVWIGLAIVGLGGCCTVQ